MGVIARGVASVRCGFCRLVLPPEEVDVVDDAGAVVCDGCLDGMSGLEDAVHSGDGLVGAGVELDAAAENDDPWLHADLPLAAAANDLG